MEEDGTKRQYEPNDESFLVANRNSTGGFVHPSVGRPVRRWIRLLVRLAFFFSRENAA